jgi:tetratricopeptide (TPR) repeat protein
MFVAAAAAEDDALLAKAEESFRAALKANVFDVAALSGLGHLARQRGDLAGALNYFRRIMEADKHNVMVRCIAIEILNTLSRHDEAAALAKEVHALQSQNAPLNDDADEAATLPSLDEAEAMFKSVLERHPKNLGALAGLGRLARRRGDRLAMLKYYTAALAIDPVNITLRLEVARALKEQGEVALAQQILEIVLAEQRVSQRAG